MMDAGRNRRVSVTSSLSRRDSSSLARGRPCAAGYPDMKDFHTAEYA